MWWILPAVRQHYKFSMLNAAQYIGRYAELHFESTVKINTFARWCVSDFWTITIFTNFAIFAHSHCHCAVKKEPVFFSLIRSSFARNISVGSLWREIIYGFFWWDAELYYQLIVNSHFGYKLILTCLIKSGMESESLVADQFNFQNYMCEEDVFILILSFTSIRFSVLFALWETDKTDI